MSAEQYVTVTVPMPASVPKDRQLDEHARRVKRRQHVHILVTDRIPPLELLADREDEG